MTWLPLGNGSPGADLSDDAPQAVGSQADPGADEQASRADHVHTLGQLGSITFVSPDGTLWEFDVDNDGVFGTQGTQINVRVTDEGARITGSGGLRTVENV